MMMSKNWGFDSSRITTIVLAGLVGIIAPGCTSIATSNVQQGKTSQSINTPSETVRLKQQQNSSTIDPQSNEIQTTNNNSPHPAERFGLEEGMQYQEARKLLIQQGWRPYLLGEPPDFTDPAVKELFDLGYQEVKSCSGTGLGPCRFEFTNQAGELLVVSAITGGAENIKRVVWRWFIEEKIEENQKSSFSPINQENLPFVGTRGFNFLGGTGTAYTITIAADGTTIVKLHGTFTSSVQYNGKFANPIIFEDGLGLLFKDNRIYSLTADGQIAKGCKGEGKLCDSELYDLSPSSD
jgi:hypothetical protein